MEKAYAALFAVGAVAIILSLIFGEMGSDHDGFLLLSPLAIAAGMTAGGATGFVFEQYSILPIVSVIPAIVMGIVAFLAVMALKSSLKKQESNSHFSEKSYENRSARVLGSEIAVGDWGQIMFTDATGARVTRTAFNSHDAPLPGGSDVVIHTFDDKSGKLFVAPMSN